MSTNDKDVQRERPNDEEGRKGGIAGVDSKGFDSNDDLDNSKDKKEPPVRTQTG